MEAPLEAIEQCCASLARQGRFLKEGGIDVGADGSINCGYGFWHSQYQQVICEQIAPALQMRLKMLIGQPLQASAAD